MSDKPWDEATVFFDRMPSKYPLQVGVSYLGAKRPDARRIITDLTDTHVTYTHPPSYRSRETVTREEFTDWAVEIYLGHPDMPLPVPDGVEL